MENTEGASPKTPQSLDEFIERYAPLFTAHPGELVMVIERDDDDGFRGGPSSAPPWGDMFKGAVRNTRYGLAIIDPSRSFDKGPMVVALPVGPSLLVHCHGTHTLEFERLDLNTMDLLRMEETLADMEHENGPARLSKWEICVGDEAVRKAAALVHNGRELLALNLAARQLGRPIEGVSQLDRAKDLQVDEIIVDILKWMPRVTARDLDQAPEAVSKHLATLRLYGIDLDAAKELCLKKVGDLLKIILVRAFHTPAK